jgi:biotin synthesis protein BioG
MIKQWINQSGNPGMLIFFNGWGMDAKPFARLDATGLDVLMIYDYSSLEFPVDIDALAGRYSSCRLTAWSLGVWAAASALSGSRKLFSSTLAVNGTLRPVNAEYGIAPEIFQGTIDSWNTVARKKFYRRMCAVPEITAAFCASEPERDVDSQQQELIAIQQAVLNHPQSPASFFDRAVAGSEDRIFPAAAQQNFWTSVNVPCKITAAPHYPFAGLRHWKELIDFEHN